MKHRRQRQEENGTESILRIDEFQLDKEWCNQPRLYCKYAEELASAKRVLDETEAELDVVEAQLDKDVREDSEAYGIAKITEKVLEHTIRNQKGYKQALQDVIDSRYRVNMLNAVVVALDHRKRALESLVSLHGQQYFSTPRLADREATEEVNKRAARRKSQLRRRAEDE